MSIKYKVPVQLPVGVSNRHIHLSQDHVDILFGVGYQLRSMKPLVQPGQFACQETLTIVGPKGKVANVRVLGPVRSQTQVEISRTDAFSLGIKPPVRDSGKLAETPGCVLIGPLGSVKLDQGVILASRHLHCSVSEAKKLSLEDGDRVNVLAVGERSVVFNNVLVRCSDDMSLEFHLDTDEANACLLASGDKVLLMEKVSDEDKLVNVLAVKEKVAG